MVWCPPDYIDTAEELIEQFNDEHPHIQVEYRSIPWANWSETFVTAIGSGTAPDISTGAGYQSAQFYEIGAIMPINDVIDELRQKEIWMTSSTDRSRRSMSMANTLHCRGTSTFECGTLHTRPEQRRRPFHAGPAGEPRIRA
jgi:hypothetical protein